MKQVLTIAGSDPSGGAGIQADLKTIHANGAYGLSVITAVTAQNTVAVTDSLALPDATVQSQLNAVFADCDVAAVKTGMLASAEIVAGVADALRRHNARNVVVDPVMVASSGRALLEPEAFEVLCRKLLPLATLVTPNVSEAERLAGMTIRSLAEAEEAARRILAMGPKAVLVKGGHLEAAPGTDLLHDDRQTRCFAGEFIDTPHTHGTGCTYSAAIATHLARGCELPAAVEAAKAYLTEAIRHARPIGHGAGPLCHFHAVDFGGPVGRAAALHGRAEPSGFPRGVHYVTDRRRLRGITLEAVVEQAVAGGVTAIHLREPELPVTELLPLAERLRRLTAGRCALVINDRVDVALAVGADGVQLGHRSLPVTAARKVVGSRMRLGRSVHSVAEATAAEREGADFLLLGTLFATESHPEVPPAGPGLVSATRAAVQIPVIGIGGISAANVSEVMAAGADGIAVIGAIQGADAVEAAARQLVRLVTEGASSEL